MTKNVKKHVSLDFFIPNILLPTCVQDPIRKRSLLQIKCVTISKETIFDVYSGALWQASSTEN